jgi:phosphoribosylglycinamide formyltransferase 1
LGRAGSGPNTCRRSGALVDCGVVLSSSPRTLAVLASGQGTNFEALARASQRLELGGTISLLLTDRPEAPVIERAARFGIETLALSCGRFRTRIEDERPWVDALRERGVDTLLLAGFMRRLHEPLLEAYRDRILNVHPSLLPAFPGLDAIWQALEHGVKVTGCTVHMVDGTLDGGPILAQAAVEVREDDRLESLAARVHEAEHRLYPWAVRRFLEVPWRRQGRALHFDLPSGVSHA